MLIQGPRESWGNTRHRETTGESRAMNRGRIAGLWGNQGADKGDPGEHGRDRGPMGNQGRDKIISPGMNQGRDSKILGIY